jgi:chromosome segregation ATPase
MSEGNTSSGLVQVAIALIGVVGSLGVAWITTGTKFESELSRSQETIVSLRQQVDQLNSTFKPTIESLTRQQDEANKKIGELSELLKATEGKNTELQNILAEIKAQIGEAGNRTQELKNATQTAQLQITEFRKLDPEILKRMRSPRLQPKND